MDQRKVLRVYIQARARHYRIQLPFNIKNATLEEMVNYMANDLKFKQLYAPHFLLRDFKICEEKFILLFLEADKEKYRNNDGYRGFHLKTYIKT